MSRLVIISEIPVSYRTGWFQHLVDWGVDLHVVYLAERQSDRPWEGPSDLPRWASLAPSLKLGGTARGHFPRLSPLLGRTLDGLHPDVVLLPGWAHPACWQAAAWCERRKLLYGVMGETWHRQAETTLPTRLTGSARNALLRRSSIALPIGRLAARFFRENGASNVHVVHANSCDVSAVRTTSKGIARADVPEVLFVGRLLEHKGAGLLDGIARRLGDAGVRLRVVGDGPMAPNIEQITRDRCNVAFDGPLEPRLVHQALARASATIVPSLKEPWGVVVHESLAAGTPVAASNRVGSAADLICDTGGVVGRVTEPTADAISAAAVELASGADLSDECRAAAATIDYRIAAEELVTALTSIGCAL